MFLRAKMRQLVTQSGTGPLRKDQRVMLVLATLVWACAIAFVTRGLIHGAAFEAMALLLAYTTLTTWLIWNLSEAPEILQEQQHNNTKYWPAVRQVSFVVLASSVLFPVMLWICMIDWENN
jgi:hypothetical protein